jgi:outer membrane lipoprotein-sorting protein
VFETQFSDYRTVEGMTMPFSIKTVAAGMTLNEMKLTKIEVNPKLDDAVFKIK